MKLKWIKLKMSHGNSWAAGFDIRYGTGVTERRHGLTEWDTCTSSRSQRAMQHGQGGYEGGSAGNPGVPHDLLEMVQRIEIHPQRGVLERASGHCGVLRLLERSVRTPSLQGREVSLENDVSDEFCVICAAKHIILRCLETDGQSQSSIRPATGSRHG